MTARRTRAVIVVMVVVVVLGPLFGPLSVGRSAAAPPDTFAVVQGTVCTEVSPLTNTSQNVETFYDYRNTFPNITGNPESDTFSSFGTTEYQDNQVSKFLFYEGSNGTSLVIIHDQLNGSNASTISMSLRGLPSNGSWVVEDDEYPNRTDNFDHSGTSSEIDWKWSPNRTDGGVFRGLDNDSFSTIALEPRFNENADKWGQWTHSGTEDDRIDDWRVISAGGAERSLDLNETVYIHGGSCVSTSPPTATLSPATATISSGESVAFDASGSTDDGEVASYHWDFDGDGSVDQRTVAPTTSHVYTTSGTVEAAVTVVDTYGNANSTTSTITVESAPLSAAIDAPQTVTVGESFTLDGSASTAPGNVTSYAWTLGDGTNATGQTVNHTYTEAGEFTVELTVTDDSNTTSTTTTTITAQVNDTESPVAAFAVPPDPTVETPLTFDASGSTDDTAIVEYRWDFDGDGTPDVSTGDTTVTHTFNSTGASNVSLTVVDTEGNTNRTTQTITLSNETLTPAFEIRPSTPEQNEQVTFDANPSANHAHVDQYQWEFGDGSAGAGRQVTYAYSSSGTYTVTLTLVGRSGATVNQSKTVEVVEADDSGGGGGGSSGGSGGGSSGGSGGGSSGGGGSSSSGGGGGGSAPPAPTPTPQPEPSISVVSVTPVTEEVIEEQPFYLDTTLFNGGDAPGTFEVRFTVNGDVVERRNVSLAPNETTTVRFSHRFTDVEPYDVGVNGNETEIRVQNAEPNLSVTGVSATPTTVGVNETITVTATVENTGYDDGTKEVRLFMFGEVVEASSVTVPARTTRRVSFERRIEAPGTYVVVVDGQRTTITVESRTTTVDATTERTSERTDRTAPGFGALTGALGVVTLILFALARRRHRR